MKRLLILVLSLVLCIVVLVGCGKEPDTDEPTIDELLSIGMTYQEVTEIVGQQGITSEICSNIMVWDTGSDEDLYVWFNRLPDDPLATVTRAELRSNLEPEIAMTRAEVNTLLGSVGREHNRDLNIYVWEAPGEKDLYAWFDKNDMLLRYDLTASPNDHLIGITYRQAADFFRREGTPVNDIYEVYGWETYVPNKYIYIAFDNGVSVDAFVDSEISIKVGATYERIAYIYAKDGVTVGKGAIYSWPTSESTIGIFKFKNINSTLVLEQFVLDAHDLSGMTLAEINGLLGTEGIAADDTSESVYKWDSEFDEDIYVWFDSDMIATKFSYTTGATIKLEPGIRRDEVISLLGEPIEKSGGKRWYYDGYYAVYIVFDNDLVEKVYKVKHFNAYIGMTEEEVRSALQNTDFFSYATQYGKLLYHMYIITTTFWCDENGDALVLPEKVEYYIQVFFKNEDGNNVVEDIVVWPVS